MRKRQYPNKRQVQKTQARQPITVTTNQALAERAEPKKVYGQPFVLLEDEGLNTFHYVRGPGCRMVGQLPSAGSIARSACCPKS